jgi:hypothetical protein
MLASQKDPMLHASRDPGFVWPKIGAFRQCHRRRRSEVAHRLTAIALNSASL